MATQIPENIAPATATATGACAPTEQPDCSMEVDKGTSPYPSHPISQLQGPFRESIVEATDKSANEWVVEVDAQTRRRDLLENDEYERLCGRKWRQRASEK